jgi:hypothetical protein
MTAVSHSRPMHSVPVPINVRCYSNSDIIVRRSRSDAKVALRIQFWSRPLGCVKKMPTPQRLAGYGAESALGHFRPIDDVRAMSAFPSIATGCCITATDARGHKRPHAPQQSWGYCRAFNPYVDFAPERLEVDRLGRMRQAALHSYKGHTEPQARGRCDARPAPLLVANQIQCFAREARLKALANPS